MELALEANDRLFDSRDRYFSRHDKWQSFSHFYAAVYNDETAHYVDRACYGTLSSAINTEEHPIQFVADISSTPRTIDDFKESDKAFLAWLFNESMFAPLFLIKDVEQYVRQGQVMNAQKYKALAIVAALFSQRMPKYYNSDTWTFLQSVGFTPHQAFVLWHFFDLNNEFLEANARTGAIDWNAIGLSYKQFLAFWEEKKNNSAWVYRKRKEQIEARDGFTWHGTNKLFHSSKGNLVFTLFIPPPKHIIHTRTTSWGQVIVEKVPYLSQKNLYDNIMSHINSIREAHG